MTFEIDVELAGKFTTGIIKDAHGGKEEIKRKRDSDPLASLFMRSIRI